MIGYIVFAGLFVIGLLYLSTSELAERIYRNKRTKEDTNDTDAV